MASSKANYIKRNYMGRTLEKLIANLNRGKPVIYGSLQVLPGHDYWWFLEYGTGEKFQEPEGGPYSPDAPPAVLDYTAEGTYAIVAKDKPLLVYVSNAAGGPYKVYKKPETAHAGIAPLAIVRTALFTAHLYLKEEIKPIAARGKRKNWGHLPTRKELIELINDVMQQLLAQLVFNTPDGAHDPNPYHADRHPIPLADAWRVTKAR